MASGSERLPRFIAKATEIKEGVVLAGSIISFAGALLTLMWNALSKALADTTNIPGNSEGDKLTDAADAFARAHLSLLAVVEALIILVMWVALAPTPGGAKALARLSLMDDGSKGAENAFNFRKRYEWLLWSWIALYATLFGAHSFYSGAAEGSLPHELLHIALTTENALSAVFLTVMYQALGGHSRSAQPEELGRSEKAPIAIGAILIGAALAWALTPHDHRVHQYLTGEHGWRLFGFASGLANAVAMGLLAGRIASPELRGGAVMAMGLQLYAGIQPVFGVFLDSYLIEFLVIALAIPLKGIMFWILSTAIADGSLVRLVSWESQTGERESVTRMVSERPAAIGNGRPASSTTGSA